MLEADTVGFGASGRNGGFALGSLTHGIENGLARFADEIDELERLGRENFAGFLADLERLGIDCDVELTGDLSVALEPHELAWIPESAELYERFGHEYEVFDQEAIRAEVSSPTYLGGFWAKTDAAVLDPGKLCAGLAEAALAAGVRIHERTRATKIVDDGPGVRVLTPTGHVRAGRVLLATSAYPPLLRAIRRYVAPVYDYALMTEPLSPAQRDAIGWKRRQGARRHGEPVPLLPPDEGRADPLRRLRRGVPVRRAGARGPGRRRAGLRDALAALLHDLPAARRRALHAPLGRRDRHVQPVRGLLRDGATADAWPTPSGYTGLGVVSTRFGARVALDLLDGRETEATRLRYVRSKPVPFPPEPLRSGVIQLTRNRLDAADRNAGRRGLWLRTLDRLGLGFDS